MTFTRANSTTLRCARLAPVARAEARLNPFGAGHDVGPAGPGAHEHHEENLVEDRPDKRDPGALQPVDEADVHLPHRAADIKHPRGVGDAEHEPGQRPSAEDIRAEVLHAPPGDPEADRDDRHKIDDDDRDIEDAKLHGRLEEAARTAAGRFRESLDATTAPVRRGGGGYSTVSATTQRSSRAKPREWPRLRMHVQSYTGAGPGPRPGYQVNPIPAMTGM